MTKSIREEQNERRKRTGERPTIESMLADLDEEAQDARTPPSKRDMLGRLIGMWRDLTGRKR